MNYLVQTSCSLAFAASLALAAWVAQAADMPAAAPVAAPATPAKPDLAKGEASFTAVCAACHGADGNSGSPEYPKLAGQHPEYLVKQLTEFKSGKRANAVMMGMSAALSEADMKNIAAWLSTKAANAKDAAKANEREV